MSTGPRSAPPELPGFTADRWLGGGGFADVFLYAQLRPSRSVAIKILRPEHLSTEALAQFDAEADIMAEVSAHPYIVTIFSSGTAPDGRPYIIMEHYPNPNFGERAKGGTMELAEVLSTGINVASAVETAHRAGIIHRDIKPANILTSRFNRPGLTDFGIAGVQTNGPLSGAVGVTIPYTAPEVLDDQSPGSVAADVYGLGATISALASGHSPYWSSAGENTDHAVLGRALAGHITPLTRPDVPRSLSLLLAQAMSRDPAHRPTSALAFARSMQQIEQELRLQPTSIELDPDNDRRRDRSDDGDGEERTRRSIQVVDPLGDAAPRVAEIPGSTLRPTTHPPSTHPPTTHPPSTHPPATRPAATRPAASTPSPVRPPAAAPAAPSALRSRMGAPRSAPRSADAVESPDTIARVRATPEFRPDPIGESASPAKAPSSSPRFGPPPLPEEPPTPADPFDARRRLGDLPWKPIGAVAALVAVVAIVVALASSGSRNAKDDPGNQGAGGALVQSMPTSDTTVAITGGTVTTPTDIALAAFMPDAQGNLTSKLTWTAAREPGTKLSVQVVAQHAPSVATTIVLDATAKSPAPVVLSGAPPHCTGVQIGSSKLDAAYCKTGPPCLEVTAQKLNAGSGNPVAVPIRTGAATKGSVDADAYDQTCSVTLSGGN